MKPLYRSIKHFLVQVLHVSFDESIRLIMERNITVNGVKPSFHLPIYKKDKIVMEGRVLQEPVESIYIAYHKPRGIETTLNVSIPNNLAAELPFEQRLFPVGRLDKDSEGLLLLTNNGQVYDKLLSKDRPQEKEYRVWVDKPITEMVRQQLENGVEIMGQTTLPCSVTLVDECTFAIVLTQGLNRQIRRMCYKLGYQVQRLIRIRIANILLNDLPEGQWRKLSLQEIESLEMLLGLH